MILDRVKPILDSILASFYNITETEFAIFSSDSKLVSCTTNYLRKKGNKVHNESINDVLCNGCVVVNKPGHMKSCVGCRFANNCPSTIELLTSIELNDYPIGVVSLTSFTKEGHEMIDKNTRKYMTILKNLSLIISIIANHENLIQKEYILATTLNSIINRDTDTYILVDRDGNILMSKDSLDMNLPACNYCINSLSKILSDENIYTILSSEFSQSIKVDTNDFSGYVYSEPIIIEGHISGYLIKLEDIKKANSLIDEDPLDGIISCSKQIDDVKNKIKKINNSKSTVLILGETGTGKELIAKSIHYSGIRKDQPFIPINCSSFPRELFESEMFGYEEGAFTGAKKGGKQGLFEIANGGTIFLDEIGDLPYILQSKLLRVIQENVIQRIGGTTLIPINVRIIAATNQNLKEMVDNKKFRDDLYYRLNVIPLVIPPLRKRLSDLPLLVNHFINKYNKMLNKKIISMSKPTLSLLQRYNWPGNIRELENIIEYAVNMEESSIIKEASLPEHFLENNLGEINIKDQINNFEYKLIVDLLNLNGWDIQGKEKTAKELGMSLRTLYRKLNHHR